MLARAAELDRPELDELLVAAGRAQIRRTAQLNPELRFAERALEQQRDQIRAP
jgi:hypothetical protein